MRDTIICQKREMNLWSFCEETGRDNVNGLLFSLTTLWIVRDSERKPPKKDFMKRSVCCTLHRNMHIHFSLFKRYLFLYKIYNFSNRLVFEYININGIMAKHLGQWMLGQGYLESLQYILANAAKNCRVCYILVTTSADKSSFQKLGDNL